MAGPVPGGPALGQPYPPVRAQGVVDREPSRPGEDQRQRQRRVGERGRLSQASGDRVEHRSPAEQQTGVHDGDPGGLQQRSHPGEQPHRQQGGEHDPGGS